MRHTDGEDGEIYKLSGRVLQVGYLQHRIGIAGSAVLCYPFSGGGEGATARTTAKIRIWSRLKFRCIRPSMKSIA